MCTRVYMYVYVYTKVRYAPTNPTSRLGRLALGLGDLDSLIRSLFIDSSS